MPCNLSSREQLARTIREEDILLLHDLYTKCYLVPQSSIKLSKTYSPKDLMQRSPSKFKQLTRTTHIAFGKLCNLLRGDSIFYNNSRHKQIALEIQVAVGLSRLRSNDNGASIGKIQMIFGPKGCAIIIAGINPPEMERVMTSWNQGWLKARQKIGAESQKELGCGAIATVEADRNVPGFVVLL
ncbi:hypothetical protein BY996DRAFT_6608770 [Phakopsora pachyrhizi]|nr:hypothetical protein BY996DRAFT_6608770 [Phakopsora pachyrhizi]